MRFFLIMFKRMSCILNGHRYIIEFYKSNGEIKAYKCLHCDKIKRCKTTS